MTVIARRRCGPDCINYVCARVHNATMTLPFPLPHRRFIRDQRPSAERAPAFSRRISPRHPLTELPSLLSEEGTAQGLLRALKLHILVHRELRRRAAEVGTGADRNHVKAAGTGLDLIAIRRTLPGNANVVRRDQFVEGSIFSLGGKVAALGLGDAGQIASYAG